MREALSSKKFLAALLVAAALCNLCLSIHYAHEFADMASACGFDLVIH